MSSDKEQPKTVLRVSTSGGRRTAALPAPRGPVTRAGLARARVLRALGEAAGIEQDRLRLTTGFPGRDVSRPPALI